MESSKCIGDYEERVQARLFGFKSKEDYYKQAGSISFLSRIRVPTVVINARDDPFIDERSLPTETEHIGKDAPVRLVYHEQGGHCGFLAHRPPSSHGWMAEELAKVLMHIDTELFTLTAI